MSDGQTTDARHISDTERIRQVDLQKEMQRSYLDYAMSVIVGRALPDVRDGLKPVHLLPLPVLPRRRRGHG